MSSVSCFEKLFREGLLWFAAQDGSKAHTGGSPLASTQLPTHQRVVKFCLPQIDQVLPQHGLAFGALHEWCLQDPVSPQQFMPCSLPTILAAHAIEQDPALQNKFSIWIGEAIWPSAFCIQQSFPAEYFERCIFIDPPNQKLLLWSIETALRSHAAAVIVAQCPALSFALTRRFALAVKKSGALGFLVRKPQHIKSCSAATTKWLLTPYPAATTASCFKLQLLRSKASQLTNTDWLIEINEGKHATVSLSIPSQLVGPSRPTANPEPGPHRTVPGRKVRQSTRRKRVLPTGT